MPRRSRQVPSWGVLVALARDPVLNATAQIADDDIGIVDEGRIREPRAIARNAGCRSGPLPPVRRTGDPPARATRHRASVPAVGRSIT